MPYIRISLMQPMTGQEARVNELLDALTRGYEDKDGYLYGWRLEPVDRARHVGRLAIWEDDSHAHHAAQDEHEMALRSQLNQVIEDGSHEELSFHGIPAAPIHRESQQR